MQHKNRGWIIGLSVGIVGTYLYAQLYDVPPIALVLAICATVIYAVLGILISRQ